MMNRIFTTILVMGGFLPTIVLGQTTQYTTRSKNEVREGPGNYYPVSWVLPRGVALPIAKRQDGWMYFGGLGSEGFRIAIKGWISRNCLIAQQPKKVWKDYTIDVESWKASPATVAAGVRGFGLRYGKMPSTVVDSVLSFREKAFTVEEYLQFKTETKPVRLYETETDLQQNYLAAYDISTSEEGIGLGIAARLARQGVHQKSSLAKYVNLLATLLAEESGAYDYRFTVFLLRDPSVNAFAVPGGYVFLTEGLLDLCRDEAELAGVIAHELVHIIMQHGIKETKERSPHIRMDEVMTELAEETGEEPDSVEADLEEFAIQAYENVMKRRIQSYEEEADKGAAVILARAGYDPAGISRMILRIRDGVRRDYDLQMENPFAHLDFEKRERNISEFINQMKLVRRGSTHADRFSRNVKD